MKLHLYWITILNVYLVSLKPLWGFQMNDNCWQWPEKMLSLCLKVLVIIWWQLINLSAGPVCRHHHHILADLNWLHSQESRRYILWGKYHFEAAFELHNYSCIGNKIKIDEKQLMQQVVLKNYSEAAFELRYYTACPREIVPRGGHPLGLIW